jgi:hypothetical protein
MIRRESTRDGKPGDIRIIKNRSYGLSRKSTESAYYIEGRTEDGWVRQYMQKVEHSGISRDGTIPYNALTNDCKRQIKQGILSFWKADGKSNFSLNNSGSMSTELYINENITVGKDVDKTIGIGDTKIARTGTGELSINDNRIYRAGGADIPVADGGTGLSTFGAANRILKTSDATTLSASDTLPNDVQDNITRLGTVSSGTIASGFGSINNGSDTITTTGAVGTGALTSTTGEFTGNTVKIGTGATGFMLKNDSGVIKFRNVGDSADVTIQNPKMTGSMDGSDNNPVIGTAVSNQIRLAFNDNNDDFYVRLYGPGSAYDNAIQFYSGIVRFTTGIFMNDTGTYGINAQASINDTGANTLSLTEDILVAPSVGIRGQELITSDYADNGTFTNDTGNWAVHDPETTGGVSILHNSQKLVVTTSDTSTEIQGVKLAKDYFDTLTAGKEYIVTVTIQGLHANALTNYYIGLGGAVSSAFSVSTNSVEYTKKITVNSDNDLLIYNTNAYSGTSFNIDNVSIKEWGIPLLSSRDEASITGAENKNASFNLISDEGDDNGDTWKTNATILGTYQIQNNISGSQVTQFQIAPNATVANGTSTFYTQLKVNTETAAGSETGKIAVLDSGVIKYRTPAQIRDEVGGNVVIITHNFDGTSTGAVYIPFGGSQIDSAFTSDTLDDETRFIAPFAGKLIKVMFQCASAPGNTDMLLRVNGTDGDWAYDTSFPAGLGALANTTYTIPIDSGSNSFAAGDRLRVKFDPTNAPDETCMTTVWTMEKVI